jgi:DNA-directed RNA polymerase subunit RPC12/RpoP
MVALRAPDPLWRCSRCTETKALDAFPRDRSRKNGHATTCKDCQARRVFEWRHRTGRTERFADDMSRWDIHGNLRCSRCREHKPVTEFWQRAAGPAKMVYCKPCQAEWLREWRAGRPASYERQKAKKREGHAVKLRALRFGFASVEAYRSWCLEDARAMARDEMLDRAMDDLRGGLRACE